MRAAGSFTVVLLSTLVIVSILALAVPLLSTRPVHATLVAHTPIYINGNAGFTKPDPVNGGGSGMVSDPYIIENWVIDASSANGIDIQNTTAYFVIRNCLVNNVTYPHYGIYLANVINGTIENNICSGNLGYGICLQSSSHDNVTNNVCQNALAIDIELLSSNNNTVISNNCSGVYYYHCTGIYLESSDNNILDNNTCETSWGYRGIYITSSNNNIISNNIVSGYTYEDYGTGIYLEYSSNDNLTNNTCSNNNCGITLFFSSYNNLANNTSESNGWEYGGYYGGYGIYLSSSSTDNINNNVCENNYYDGIYLQSSSNESLISNICLNNSNYGIALTSSNSNIIILNYLLNNTDNNAYDDNINSWDNGSIGNYWDDWQPPSHPSTNGIYTDSPRPIVGGSDYDNYPLVITYTLTMVTNAGTTTPSVGTHTENYGENIVITANSPGTDCIFIGWTGTGTGSYTGTNNPSSVTMYANITETALWTNHSSISINGDSQFTSSNGVTSGAGTSVSPYIIDNWIISASTANGIWVQNTTSYFIVQNCLIDNGGSTYNGIELDNVQNGTITNNNCINNNCGIYLNNSTYDNLNGNICKYNTQGICLSSSFFDILSNNNCSNNSDGIYLTSSDYNILNSNTCSNNSGIAIYLYFSSNDNMTNNNCANNGSSSWGMYLVSSSNNNIVNNNCDSSCSVGSGGCIYLESSNSNNVTNNSCSPAHYGSAIGIVLSASSFDNVIGNSGAHGAVGICLSSSSHNNVDNNSFNEEVYSFELSNSSYNNLESNSGSGSTNGIKLVSSTYNNLAYNQIFWNDQGGIYLSSSDHNILENNTSIQNGGLNFSLTSSNYNILENNTCHSSNSMGKSGGDISLTSSNNNNMINNNCTDAVWGIYLNNSSNNISFHNYLGNNTYNVYDNGTNSWDSGYPSGGNYWSDYTGFDNYRGENQDIPGSDGIGDTPYCITGGSNQDRYPLMNWPLIRRVSVSISPNSQSGLNWATLTYTVTVSNTGNVSDTYTLENTDDAGWTKDISPTLLTISAGSSENATLDVAIPENAIGGTIDDITVTATSQTDNTVSASASCTAQATVARSVSVSISPSSKSGTDNVTLTYTVTVSNTGNISDNYILTDSDNAVWGPSLSENSFINIGSGENRQTTLSVTIPENALPGTSDNIVVIATSQVDNTVSDNASCIASVAPSGATVSLVTGSNLVGFTAVGINDTPHNVFPGLTYLENYRLTYWVAPGGPYKTQPEYSVLKDNTGYWVWIDRNNTVTTSGTRPASRTENMKAGQNLVCFPVDNASTTPHNVFPGLTYLENYRLTYWVAPGGPYKTQGEFSVLCDNTGYWVWIDRNFTITVPA